jgi:phenylacetate-coenzyme A ligase PaaK-like adenylate-forming protein
MADYEALRQAHVERLLELMPEHLERLTWPVERLRVEREKGLRALVAHAKARSPWHGRRLAAVDAARLREADLAALPVMTKDDLMEHFDEIVTDPRLTREVVETHLAGLTTDAYLLDEYHVCASGGSSGRRGAFVYDRDAWAAAFISYFRLNLRMSQQVLVPGAGPSVMAMVAADKATHMTSAMGQTFTLPGRVTQRLPATWPLERIVAGLNELKPDYLAGYASMIHQLAGEAAAGRLRIAPRMVGATSEPLLPEIRAAVAAAWGAPLFNGFGSTEGLMGGSCGATRGIHLSDDLFVIEPVDSRGKPVPPGERAAKVYLTNLYNRTQPLIRYELTDEVTVLDGPCPCGVTLLRIDDIQGRLDDCFTYPGGQTVHPFTFRSALGQERAVIEYQVRQTARGADILVCCQGAVDTARLAAAIERALVDLGLASAEVSVTPVEALARQTTGKLKRFVPLAAAGEGAAAGARPTP